VSNENIPAAVLLCVAMVATNGCSSGEKLEEAAQKAQALATTKRYEFSILDANISFAGVTAASKSSLAMIQISRALQEQDSSEALAQAKEHVRDFEEGMAALHDAASSVRTTKVASVFSPEERTAIQTYIEAKADLIEAKSKSLGFLVRFAKTGNNNWMQSYYSVLETITALESGATEQGKKIQSAF
jgi:hypothetical protein